MRKYTQRLLHRFIVTFQHHYMWKHIFFLRKLLKLFLLPLNTFNLQYNTLYIATYFGENIWAVGWLFYVLAWWDNKEDRIFGLERLFSKASNDIDYYSCVSWTFDRNLCHCNKQVRICTQM